MACWERWLAMANVGGGVMSDADTINYGARPGSIKIGRLTIHENYPDLVPSMVSGTGSEFQRMVDEFISYESPEPNLVKHASDMLLLQDMDWMCLHLFAEMDTVLQYGKERWIDRDIVHFAWGSTIVAEPGITKAEFIMAKRPIAGFVLPPRPPLVPVMEDWYEE